MPIVGSAGDQYGVEKAVPARHGLTATMPDAGIPAFKAPENSLEPSSGLSAGSKAN